MNYSRIFVIALTVLLLFFAGSCEVTIYQLGEASGSVVNADTGAGIEGAIVSLYTSGTTNEVEAAITDASGNYDFGTVSVGLYDLTASYSDDSGSQWVFTSEKVAIAWDDESQALPNVAGFPYNDDTDSGSLKIITLWNNNYMDVDAFLSLPNENSTDYYTGDIYFSEFSGLSGTKTDFYVPQSPPQGFCPENPGSIGTDETDDTIDRILVYHANKTYDLLPGTSNLYDGIIAQMDKDTRTGYGPETITLYYPPDNGSTTPTYTSSGPSDPSKLPADEYIFTGVIEYYLSAYHATSSNATVEDSSMLSSISRSDDANPRIFIFSGTNLVGYYVLPKNTDIKNASIFRINCFFTDDLNNFEFQILPDTEIAWSPRGMNGNDIIVTSGIARRN